MTSLGEGRKERVFRRSRLHRSPGHQSRGPETVSPEYLAHDHTLVGSPAMAYSGRLREHSLSPMDCSHSPRGQTFRYGGGQEDTGCTSSRGAAPDRLHNAGAAAHTPVVTPSSPKPDSPARSKHLNTDSPTQANLSSTHGLVCDPPPAQASQDVSRHAGSRSAASRLSPSHLAKAALPPSPRQGPQQPLQHPAANGAEAGQSRLQHHRAVTKRKLDLSTASHLDPGRVPTDGSNTDTDYTTALPRHLRGTPTLADHDLHAVVHDASPVSLSHRQSVPDGAAATQRQSQTKSGKSLLKRVLRKSLAAQDGSPRGQSGSDAGQASSISSQDVHRSCLKAASDTQMLAAEAAKSKKPQRSGHGDRTQVKRSRSTSQLQLADADSDTPSDAQTKFQADMAKHRSKRRRLSSGGLAAIL